MNETDDRTTILELRQMVRAFIEARNWDQFHPPKDLAIGLITEAGELLEHFRFRREAEVATLLAEPEFRQALRHELADCLYFVLAIANKLDFDLSEAFREKLALSAQRYPPERAYGRNDKYTEL